MVTIFSRSESVLGPRTLQFLSSKWYPVPVPKRQKAARVATSASASHQLYQRSASAHRKVHCHAAIAKSAFAVLVLTLNSNVGRDCAIAQLYTSLPCGYRQKCVCRAGSPPLAAGKTGFFQGRSRPPRATFCNFACFQIPRPLFS